jgi:hypothetical protein
VPTPSYALDLFAPSGVEIGFLFGFCFLFFGFLFYPAFLFFFDCFWGSLCPYLVLPTFSAPPPRHSSIATFLSSVPAKSHPSLFRLIVLPFVYVFLWFPCILFLLYYSCFDFPLYFVFVGFPVFALVFSYIAHLYLFCVFFGFYSSTNLFHAYFATLHPFPGLFPHPHRVELPTRPSVYGVFLHAINFISLYFYCFFACNKSYLDRPAFECDVWSRYLGCRYKHYLGFQAEEDKCWLEILSHQCQGISVSLGFSALSVKK